MSGGGAGPIIIRPLLAVPKITPDEKAMLQTIADRSPVTCSRADAWKVALLVYSLLRRG